MQNIWQILYEQLLQRYHQQRVQNYPYRALQLHIGKTVVLAACSVLRGGWTY
jgi:hypothetical protein